MRLVHFAGFVGSGKTTVIESICNGDVDFIANNEQSADKIKAKCRNVDSFPFKSPCARIRQYAYRVDLMKEKKPSIIITEPPGNCLEVSAPMLNQIFVNDKEMELGPLITVVDGRKICEGISKRTSDGLRIFNMIDESDVVIVTFADLLDDVSKKDIIETITTINDDAEIVFSDSDSDRSRIKDMVFGDKKYHRPLYN